MMARHMLLLVTALMAPAHVHAQGNDAEVAKKAQLLLTNTCYRCHGQNGALEGGFSYLLDRGQLVGRKQVVPGDSSKSRLFRRIDRDEMPPEGEKPRLTKDDVAIIKRWIDAGAPDFNPPVPARAFISTDDMLRWMSEDLKKREESDRKFTRYMTLTHLHNAGRPNDELQSYRHGVTKLLNSLSWGRKLVAPTAIDPAKTIFRIDLRDYKWTSKVWDQLAGSEPYGLLHTGNATARSLYADAGCALPHVRGDWFVATASRPPLYHDILQLPTTEKELESLVRVDVEDGIRGGQVARAGFNGSAVSRNNRLIERHESSYGYYWKSYDFGKNVDQQNLFAHPLGPGSAKEMFKHDGGEIIFSLANGLQGYMLVNGEGKRLDKAPTEIVSDPKRPDRAVENGLSCMTCHVRGLLPKDDQIRDHAAKNPGAFPKKELDTILSLYPAKERFQTLLREDAEKFRKAVEQTGMSVGMTEPIAALTQLFEGELDLPLAAGEVGLKPAEFQERLKESPALARVLGNLQVPGGTVQRETFAKTFELIARTWKLGTPAPKFTAVAGKSGDEKEGRFFSLGGRNPLPGFLQPTAAAFNTKDGLQCRETSLVVTRDANFLSKDFTLDLVYTLDHTTDSKVKIMLFGIGEPVGSGPRKDPNGLYLRLHPLDLGDGDLALTGPKGGLPGLGQVKNKGTHLVRMEKKGDVVTFEVCMNYDGKFNADFSKSVTSLKEVVPGLTDKTTRLFFGHGGTFKQIRLTVAK
jgi:hypothetical protein